MHQTQKYSMQSIADKFRVSRQTIYTTISRCRLQEFVPRNSTNTRYKSAKYGIKRLSKVEREIELWLKSQAKRYNKSYPGEMVHVNTKRLPTIKGDVRREYLFVGIDDFSREIYADILPDKSQYSSTNFLHRLVDECPYTIECVYSDNGHEYKGTIVHEFVNACREYRIDQKFTKVATPQTNGKAERVIRTLMEMWHNKVHFTSAEDRRTQLRRFLNFYNTVKPHKGIDNLTPYEKLEIYFKQL